MDQPPIVRPDKVIALQFVTSAAPHLLEILEDCRDSETWRRLWNRFDAVTSRLKILSYVLIYDDVRRLYSAFFNGLMSREDQEEWAREFEALSADGQKAELNDLARPGGWGEQLADALFPDSAEAEAASLREFENLDAGDKQVAIGHAQYLWAFILAWLHDVLAVMVHGERMFSLVPKALAGDQEAFLKAVNVDKNLISDHPEFAAIHQKAIREGNSQFLGKVARRLGAPVTQGRIRLPGVFIVFAMLEAIGWLDGLLYREILDICDEAKLDRWCQATPETDPLATLRTDPLRGLVNG